MVHATAWFFRYVPVVTDTDGQLVSEVLNLGPIMPLTNIHSVVVNTCRLFSTKIIMSNKHQAQPSSALAS